MKATDTHSRYVILIAFTLQQWLHERASMLRHAYIACLAPFIAFVTAVKQGVRIILCSLFV